MRDPWECALAARDCVPQAREWALKRAVGTEERESHIIAKGDVCGRSVARAEHTALYEMLCGTRL